MTEKEICDLEAGYELNVLVATKVMGRNFPTFEEMKETAEEQWKDQPSCIHFFRGFDAWLENGEFKWKYNTDAYSTNIGSAFEVIDKMYEKGFECSLWMTDDYTQNDECYRYTNANFFRPMDKGKTAEYDGKTTPEAICKAALLVELALAPSID